MNRPDWNQAGRTLFGILLIALAALALAGAASRMRLY